MSLTVALQVDQHRPNTANSPVMLCAFMTSRPRVLTTGGRIYTTTTRRSPHVLTESSTASSPPSPLALHPHTRGRYGGKLLGGGGKGGEWQWAMDTFPNRTEHSPTKWDISQPAQWDTTFPNHCKYFKFQLKSIEINTNNPESININKNDPTSSKINKHDPKSIKINEHIQNQSKSTHNQQNISIKISKNQARCVLPCDTCVIQLL